MHSTEDLNHQNAEAMPSEFDGGFHLVEKLDRSRLTATYRVRDEIGDEYLLIEFLHRDYQGEGDETGEAEFGAHDMANAPTILEYFEVAEHLSRLRHPNIEAILQTFEHNGTGYAVVEASFASSAAEQICGNAFYYQPSEILLASQALIEAAAYLDALDVDAFNLSLDSFSIDDDARPCISIRHCMELLLDADARRATGASALKYGAAASVYAMLTGNQPHSRRQRQALITSGQRDPYKPLTKTSLPYPPELLAEIDGALSLDKAASGVDLAKWARKIREIDAVITAPGDADPARRSGGFGWLVAATLLLGIGGAGWYGHKTGMLDDVIAQATTLANEQIAKLTPSAPAEVAAADTRPLASDQTVAAADPVDTDLPAGVETEVVVPDVTALFAGLSDGASDDTAAEAQGTEAEAPGTGSNVAGGAARPAAPEEAPSPPVTEPAAEPEPDANESELALADTAARPSRPALQVGDLNDAFLDLAGKPTSTSKNGPAESAEGDAAPSGGAPRTPSLERDAALRAALAPASRRTDPDPAAGSQDAGADWLVDLNVEYELLRNDADVPALMISHIEDEAAFTEMNDWYMLGIHIHAVGGIEVDDGFSLEAALEAHFARRDRASPYVELSISWDGAGGYDVAELLVPVRAVATVQGIDLVQDGTEGAWLLTVADAASSGGASLQAGDVLVSEQTSNTPVATIGAFKALIENARAIGQEELSFLVRGRAGDERTVWVPTARQ